jgi:hypothetical protein
VHWRRCSDVPGIDERQLGGVYREYLGQHVGEILQQLKPIHHLARRGRPSAGASGVCPRAIPQEYLDPGMRLKPLCQSSGVSSGYRKSLKANVMSFGQES